MDDSAQPATTVDAHYVRVGAADARTVARIRGDFSAWIRRCLAVDDERISDIVLAVNEALSNSAEFAYVGSAESGSMIIEANHDAATATLDIVVTDQGAWYCGVPPPRHDTRGRGIALMRALADSVSIDSSSDGTRVTMRFRNCASVPHRPGAMSDA